MIICLKAEQDHLGFAKPCELNQAGSPFPIHATRSVKMGIKVKGSLIHWNYYLALEADLDRVSRYIEFSPKNFSTYSIELAHLLLASASEVDVVVKEICKILAPTRNVMNINDYRKEITTSIPEFAREQVYIPRYGIVLDPWKAWRSGSAQNPLWWRGYNKVKHQRDAHFEDANLKHVINSIGGLLIATFYFYKLKYNINSATQLSDKDITQLLKPNSTLLRLSEEKYYSYLITG